MGELKEAGDAQGLFLVMTNQELCFLAARPLANHTAKAVIEAFHWEWVVLFGKLSKITTVNASEFVSSAWADYCALLASNTSPQARIIRRGISPRRASRSLMRACSKCVPAK